MPSFVLVCVALTLLGAGCSRQASNETLTAKTRKLIDSGNVQLSSGTPQTAMDDFNQAIKLDPKLAEAYLDRAMAYEELKNTDAALKDYAQAIQLSPEYSQAYFQRANVELTVSGDNGANHAKALADYNKAIELSPKNAGYYLWRGMAKAGIADYKGALADYDQAEKLGLKDSMMLLNNREETERLLGLTDAAQIDKAAYEKLNQDENNQIKGANNIK